MKSVIFSAVAVLAFAAVAVLSATPAEEEMEQPEDRLFRLKCIISAVSAVKCQNKHFPGRMWPPPPGVYIQMNLGSFSLFIQGICSVTSANAACRTNVNATSVLCGHAPRLALFKGTCLTNFTCK